LGAPLNNLGATWYERTMRFEEMPMAPGGEGFLGHNAAFRNDRMGSLRVLAQCKDPLVRLRMPVPGVMAMVASSPDAIQEALVEKGKSFAKSDMLRFCLWNLVGEGLFTSNGELWRTQRRRMADLFTPRALETYVPDMVACTLRTMQDWQDGGELMLHHETTRLTMGVAGKTLFAADTFSDADEIGRELTVALDWTGWIMGRPLAISHIVARRSLLTLAERAELSQGAFAPLGARAARSMADRLHGPFALFGTRGRELARAIAFLDKYVQGMIDERRGHLGREADLLSRLLDARDDAHGEHAATMSDRQVRDEILTLFVAGHETTAAGLAWTLYYLCRSPEVYAAVEREIDAACGEDAAPDASTLPQLDLTLRAFKEALRLAPPVYMFGRDTTEPLTLCGYELPRRTNVMFCPYALHHNAQYWPDPERFDPDRFLPANEAARSRYAYLPFGAGPRICLGNHFAYMEAQIALALMMRRYRFELVSGAPEEQPDASATLRPKHGVRVRITRRAGRVVPVAA
jgi:cytochrome P450